MKKRSATISIAVLLLFVLTSLAFAAPALARAQRIALTGTETRYFGAPERVWAADGLTQIRGLKLTGTFAYSGADITLAGPLTVLSNATLDATGIGGNTWSMATYTDTATGVTCTGPVVGKIINALGSLKVVAPCSDGALLMGTLQDVETYPPDVAPPIWVRSNFNGVLLSPR